MGRVETGANSGAAENAEAAAIYFRGRKGFDRLLLGIRQRYEALGRFGGSVLITNLTPEEQETFSSFFQKSYYRKKNVSISVSFFEKQRALTRYGGCGLFELLTAYFGVPPVWKKDAAEGKRESRRDFFAEVSQAAGETDASRWFAEVCETKIAPWPLIRRVHSTVEEDENRREQLRRDLLCVLQGLNALPAAKGQTLRIAAFAAELSGDPHFFDEGKMAYQLLIAGIRGMTPPKSDVALSAGQEMTERNIAEAKSAARSEESRAARRGDGEILFAAGLLKDDVSNCVLSLGLRAGCGDAEEHRGLAGFCEREEPVVLTLMNLSRLTSVWTESGRVFVLENPTVFAELTDRCAKGKNSRYWSTAATADGGIAETGDAAGYGDVSGISDSAADGRDDDEERARSPLSLICSSGQPCLAVLILLDKLTASGARLYYSGDFDPEGLAIAQRLKDRYGARLTLWHYDREDYLAARSEKPVSASRLKQLDRLREPELLKIAGLLRETGAAGYQERLIGVMEREIRIIQDKVNS